MTTTRTTFILGVAGVLGMAACHDKPPCLNCDEGIFGQDDVDIPSGPDLPCGGADLLADNFNCGTCGHECVLSYPDSEYAAGTCNDGVCGPGGWSSCVPGDPITYKNCAVICTALGQTCVPNGCAGLTAMVVEAGIDGNDCNVADFPPVETMSGSCDEPIDWNTISGDPRHVICCCDYQK